VAGFGICAVKPLGSSNIPLFKFVMTGERLGNNEVNDRPILKIIESV
jgi:hypothetical protein